MKDYTIQELLGVIPDLDKEVYSLIKKKLFSEEGISIASSVEQSSPNLRQYTGITVATLDDTHSFSIQHALKHIINIPKADIIIRGNAHRILIFKDEYINLTVSFNNRMLFSYNGLAEFAEASFIAELNRNESATGGTFSQSGSLTFNIKVDSTGSKLRDESEAQSCINNTREYLEGSRFRDRFSLLYHFESASPFQILQLLNCFSHDFDVADLNHIYRNIHEPQNHIQSHKIKQSFLEFLKEVPFLYKILKVGNVKNYEFFAENISQLDSLELTNITTDLFLPVSRTRCLAYKKLQHLVKELKYNNTIYISKESGSSTWLGLED